jgi:hypothetical protein
VSARATNVTKFVVGLRCFIGLQFSSFVDLSKPSTDSRDSGIEQC